MNKYFVLIIIVILGFIIFRKPTPKPVVNQPVPQEQQFKLPDNWKTVENSTVALKLEKTVNQGLKPEIVLINSVSKDALTPAKYIDRLLAGAKSAIPSLRITKDQRSTDKDIYSATVSGYYFNNKTKVNLLQRIYIKGETVSTLTASFADGLESEINPILDSIKAF
jgi:hypothetical protein